MDNIICKTLYDYLKTISGCDFTNTVLDALKAEKIQALMADGGTVETLFSNIILPAGCALLVLYFILDIMDNITMDHFTPQSLMGTLIKFIIIYGFMRNSLEIFQLITQAGDAVVASMVGYGIEDSGIYTAFSDENYSRAIASIKAELTPTSGAWAAVVTFIQGAMHCMELVLPWMLSWASLIVVAVIAFSRAIELGARVTLAPLAVPNMLGRDLWSSAGMRYVKKIVAIAFQGAVVAVVAVVIGQLGTSITANWADPTKLGEVMSNFDAWDSIFLRVAGAGIILKSASIANDIAGA